jgi:hypothetical protein
MDITTEIIEEFKCGEDHLNGMIRISVHPPDSIYLEYQEAEIGYPFTGAVISEMNLINLDVAERVANEILERVNELRKAPSGERIRLSVPLQQDVWSRYGEQSSK